MGSRLPLRMSERFVELKSEYSGALDKRPILRDFITPFGLGHVTYFGVFPQWGADQKHQLITTYPVSWERHYFERKYDRLDPVLLQAMKGVLPFDWEQIRKDDREVRDFFGEAGEFGISDNGLSIPVRGPTGDLALFSVTSAEMTRREWGLMKAQLLPDLIYLAHLLHTEVTERVREAAPEEARRLTAREKEALSWSARGKTSWETGRILGLSERTVDFYLKNAMFKLGAANKTQAVSKAISMGALTLTFRIDL